MWFFNLLYRLFVVLFVVLVAPYKVLAWSLPVSILITLGSGLVDLILVKVIKIKKEFKLFDMITDWGFVIMFVLLTVNPVTKMSEEERSMLPCIGNVDKDLQFVVEGYAKWNSECRSVIHVGHGYYDAERDDTIFFTGSGENSVRNIVGNVYDEPVQYVFSCRGDDHPLWELFTGDVSHSLGSKEVEMINGKEVRFFAKKGTILMTNRFSNWLLFW